MDIRCHRIKPPQKTNCAAVIYPAFPVLSPKSGRQLRKLCHSSPIGTGFILKSSYTGRADALWPSARPVFVLKGIPIKSGTRIAIYTVSPKRQNGEFYEYLPGPRGHHPVIPIHGTVLISAASRFRKSFFPVFPWITYKVYY